MTTESGKSGESVPPKRETLLPRLSPAGLGEVLQELAAKLDRAENMRLSVTDLSYLDEDPLTWAWGEDPFAESERIRHEVKFTVKAFDRAFPLEGRSYLDEIVVLQETPSYLDLIRHDSTEGAATPDTEDKTQ